jgi:hypothetical protein
MTADHVSQSTAAKLIRAVLEICGEGSELVGAHEREWASATFSGARHSLDLLIPAGGESSALPDPIARLSDHEFDLAAEIVADCAVTIGQRHSGTDGCTRLALRVELLTIVAD